MNYRLYFILLLPLLGFSQLPFEKERVQFENKNKSESNFTPNFTIAPQNLETIEELGDKAAQNKCWDQALFYFEKLKELQPTVANYQYKYGGALGMKALEVNKFKALGLIDDIKKAFEKAIQLDPKHIGSRWALIDLYLKLPGIVGGSEAKAVRYSNELLQLAAVEGHLSRGHIEEHFKRYAKAEQEYKRAIATSNSVKGYQMILNLYKNKMKDPQKAALVLQALKKINLSSNKNL